MLKGKKIHLRLVKEIDLTKLYEKWHDDEARGAYYPLALVPEPLFRQEFMKNGFWSETSKRMLIVDVNDNMLGILHAWPTNYSGCMELSYYLFDVTSRNKGFATDAINLLVNFLFNTEQVNRLQICVPVGNQASIRVAIKAGFTEEGLARGAFFLNGEYVDLHVYSLLKKEWKASL